MSGLQQRFDEEGLSRNTRRTYISQLRKVAGGSADNALAWLNSHVKKGTPMGTALPRRAAVLHYLVAECGMTEAEAKEALPKIKRRSHPEEPRRIPSAAEVLKIAAQVDALPPSAVRAVLQLLPGSGLRITEAVTLRLRDLQGGATLRVQGKGGKIRLVPLGGKTAAALSTWLAEREEAGEPTSPASFVFPSPHFAQHRPITDEACRVALHQCCQKAGIDKAYSPHSLRHAYATGVLHRGGDIADVKLLLGHQSVETTARYLHSDMERLRKLV